MKKKILISIIAAVSLVIVAVGATIGILMATKNNKPNPTPTPTQETTPTPSQSTPTPSVPHSSTSNQPKPIDEEGYRIIKVRALNGKVTVSDDEEEFEAFTGMNLYDGDTIITGENSSLTIKLDEDKYLYVYENSKIHLMSQGIKSTKTNIYVDQGKVLAEIEEKLGEDEEFYLSSSNSVMAVRGTTFGVTVEQDEENKIITFAVYKGVTELFVFDTSTSEFTAGKLSNLSNAKLEIIVPKKDEIKVEEMIQNSEKWVEECTNQYENAEDANDTMDEVQITVTKPEAEEYLEVKDKIDSTVSYSLIDYDAEGYIGAYDGNPHKVTITPKVENATVFYSLEENGTYSKENTFEFTEPGEYRVYFRIEAEGYAAKNDYAVVSISKADLKLLKLQDLSFLNSIVDTEISEILSQISIASYYQISGLDKDNEFIQQFTLSCPDKVTNEETNHNIQIVLPEEIQKYYKDTTLPMTTKGYTILRIDTLSLSTYQTPYTYTRNEDMIFISDTLVTIDSAFSDLKLKTENGFFSYDSISYFMNDEPMTSFDLSQISYSIVLHFTKDGITYTKDLSFNVDDTRYTRQIVFLEPSMEKIKESEPTIYRFTPEGDSTTLDGYLAVKKETIDKTLRAALVANDPENSENQDYLYNINGTIYGAEETVLLPMNQVTKVILFTYPDSLYHESMNYIYLATGEANLPEWNIPTNSVIVKSLPYSYSITTTTENTTITYSLDGKSFSDTLSIEKTGTFTIYYRVVNKDTNFDMTFTTSLTVSYPYIAGSNYIETETLYVYEDSIIDMDVLKNYIESYAKEHGTFTPVLADSTRPSLTYPTIVADTTDLSRITLTVISDSQDYNTTTLPLTICVKTVPRKVNDNQTILPIREIVFDDTYSSEMPLIYVYDMDGRGVNINDISYSQGGYYSNTYPSPSASSTIYIHGFFYQLDSRQIHIFSSTRFVKAQEEGTVDFQIRGEKVDDIYLIDITDYEANDFGNITVSAKEIANSITMIDAATEEPITGTFYIYQDEQKNFAIPNTNEDKTISLQKEDATTLHLMYYGNSEQGYRWNDVSISVKGNYSKRIRIQDISVQEVPGQTNIKNLEPQIELLIEDHVIDALDSSILVDYEITKIEYLDEDGDPLENPIITEDCTNIMVAVTVLSKDEEYPGETAITYIDFNYSKELMD